MSDTAKALRKPFAVALTSVAALWTAFNTTVLTSLSGALWASSGDLFTLVSLGALTLPPHIPPESTADWIVIAVGALFLAKVGERIVMEFSKRF